MKFDLKGSTIGRKVKFGNDKWWMKNKLGCPKIMKDSNFTEIQKDYNGMMMSLTEEECENLRQSIELDSLFLRDHGIMDYSLLLIIENIKPKTKISVNDSRNQSAF